MKVTGCETLHCDAGMARFLVSEADDGRGRHRGERVQRVLREPGAHRGHRAARRRPVAGEDPFAVSGVSAKLYAATRQAPGGIAQQAIAAIENALLDIKGRALGVPVSDLLGGAVRDRLELYWSHCGTYRFGPPAEHIDRPPIETLDDLAALAREIRDRGFRGLKTNIFLFGEDGPRLHMPGFTEPRLAGAECRPARHRSASQAARRASRRGRARRRDPPRPQLQLQARGLPPGDPRPRRPRAHLVRDRPPDPAALAHIRESVRTPIASCESLFGIRGFRPYFERASMDVAIIDIPWNGAWEGIKIAAMAEGYEVNCAPTTSTATSRR